MIPYTDQTVMLILVLRSALWSRAEFDGFGFENRILFEKVGRSEFKAAGQGRHCRKIFLTWNMVESDCVPHHYIFLLYFPIPAKFYKQKNTH